MGDIALVRFPFSDLSGGKRRPTLVLATATLQSEIAVVTMITSQLDGPLFDGDLKLQDWKAAGLLHPSKVRLAKVVSLESTLLERRLGKLSNRDVRAVARTLDALLKPLKALSTR